MIDDRVKDATIVTRILTEISYIFRKTEGVSEDQFLVNEDLQHLVSMALIVIGESANHLSIEFKEKHAQIPWVQIVAVRNIAAHGYWQLDMRQIWQSITENLPELASYLQSITI